MIRQPPARLLLIKPSSMGDVIHSLPVLDALRRQWPQTEIDWLVKPEWAPLLEGHPMLREVVRLPRAWRGWAATVATLRRRRYDMMIDLQGLLRSALLGRLCGAPVRVGFSNGREGSPWWYTHRIDPPPDPVHAVDRYLDVIRQLGVRWEGVPRFPLPPWPAADAWADGVWAAERMAPDDPVCVVHPAARWSTKRWPAERFARAADGAAARGWRVIVVAGAGQAGQAEAAVGLMQRRVLNLAGGTTLPQLAALLRRAAVLVTNDSGPMHLAAAVGTPVVAMFGPTDPRKVGPYGSGHAVLMASVDCSPCRRQRCVQDGACMKAIDVEEVLKAMDKIINRKTRTPTGSFHGY
ncbi:MAG: lipopolysaccharide heptosyltransferase II [Nitrospirota bacterium]